MQGSSGERRRGAKRRETHNTVPPLQVPFLLPPLTSLAWKRKVKARVVMVKSQRHRFVFHPEDQGSISEPRAHKCDLHPRDRDLHTNFVPSEVSPRLATQPLRRERRLKSQRASFSLKYDGLLPSCLSPPPLPLGGDPPICPLPGPAFRLKADEGFQPKSREHSVPLKASCRQWAGREALGSPLLRPLLSVPSLRTPHPGQTDKRAEGPSQSHAAPRPRARPSPLPRNGDLCRPSPPAPPPQFPTARLPPLLPKSPRRSGRELDGTRACLLHFGNERNCRRAPEHTEFSRRFCIQ